MLGLSTTPAAQAVDVAEGRRQEQSIPPLPGSSSDLRAFAHGSSKEKL